jgi:hypothetical protein
LRTTSNWVNYWNQYIRTTSNAVNYEWPLLRTTSNAVSSHGSWIAEWSPTAAEDIPVWVRTTSNSMNYYAPIIRSNSYNTTVYNSAYSLSADATLNNIVFFKSGIDVGVSGTKTLTINTPSRISGPLTLSHNNTVSQWSTLKLGGDVTFGSDVTLTNHAKIDGQGKTVHLSGPLSIPSNKTLRFSGNSILDGHGNTITLNYQSTLSADNGVTLTLRNLVIKGVQYDNTIPSAANTRLKCLDNDGRLCLENVTLDLSSDYLFPQGRLFISGDVIVKGPHSFSYMSGQPMTIQSGSTLYFDLGTTFTYNPDDATNSHAGAGDYRVYRSHTDKTLLRMADSTSTLYFNGATFNVPGNGISLTNGSLVLDNRVTFNSYTDNKWTTPTTTSGNAIKFGDGTSSDNLTVYLLAAARLELTGYLDYENSDGLLG